MPDMGEMPGMSGNFLRIPSAPTLGISAEDLDGQLGAYFGAPDGEGILVREVESNSPAEKAGFKAGDVIVKIEGERVKHIGEMQEKLRAKREAKTVQVTVLRRGAEQTLTVEPNKPQTRTLRSHLVL
jgi:serine protease Do